MKPIAIGADDAAVELKAQIIKHLVDKGVPVKDYGVFDHDPMLCPDIALQVAQAVAALVDVWLRSEFQAGRSGPKVERIKEIEKEFASIH